MILILMIFIMVIKTYSIYKAKINNSKKIIYRIFDNRQKLIIILKNLKNKTNINNSFKMKEMIKKIQKKKKIKSKT